MHWPCKSLSIRRYMPFPTWPGVYFLQMPIKDRTLWLVVMPDACDKFPKWNLSMELWCRGLFLICVHSTKAKRMSVNPHSNADVIRCNAEGANEEVNDFEYLYSFISAYSNMKKEIWIGIVMSADIFNRLGNILKSPTIHTNTELQTSSCCYGMLQKHAQPTWLRVDWDVWRKVANKAFSYNPLKAKVNNNCK